MQLSGGRLLVITGEAVRDGFLAVYSVGAIIDLLGTTKNLTGNPVLDLDNGINAGKVSISDKDWARVLRWKERGDYITLAQIGQGSGRRYRWDYIPARTVYDHYLTETQRHWLYQWIEAMSEAYRQADEAIAAQSAPKAGKKQGKKRRVHKESEEAGERERQKPAGGGKRRGRYDLWEESTSESRGCKQFNQEVL